MKKLYLLLIVATLIAGCQIDYIVTNQDQDVPAVEEVSITTTIEGGITKTSYTEDPATMKATVGWEAGDKISILYQNGGYKKVEFTTTSGDGTFTGSPAGTEGGTYAYWAIYPYNICTDLYPSGSGKESMTITLPSEYTGSGAAGIPMNVHTLTANWDGTYHFKHMGSVLRFKILNIPSTARHLVISHASRDLAGRYYTTYDSVNDMVYYTTGTSDDGDQRSVTYHFTPAGDGSYSFYLPFGVTTPSGDFTFTFKNSSNEVICSRTTTLGSLASTTLARNTMYRITIDAFSFDNYPSLSNLTISPSDIDLDENQFTVSGFTFYGYNVQNYGPDNDIKILSSGGTGRIFNSSDMGRISRIVIEKGVTNYYRDSFKIYAGASSDPSSTEISYSSYDETSTTYNLATGNYHYFSIKINSEYNSYMGTITIYYKPTT